MEYGFRSQISGLHLLSPGAKSAHTSDLPGSGGPGGLGGVGGLSVGQADGGFGFGTSGVGTTIA